MKTRETNGGRNRLHLFIEGGGEGSLVDFEDKPLQVFSGKKKKKKEAKLPDHVLEE